MAKNKRAYLRDFTPTIGGYTYTGPLLHCQNPPAERRRLLATLTALAAAAPCLEALAGVLAAPGGNSFYVILPYCGAFIGAIVLAWTAGRLLLAGDPLRGYVYEGTVGKLPLRTAVTALCAGLCLVGELLFLLRHGGAGHGAEAACYCLCQAAALAAALGIRHLNGRLRFEGPPPAPTEQGEAAE